MGADPLQQESMIVDCVAAYGSITRSQDAHLCQVSPIQALAAVRAWAPAASMRSSSAPGCARHTTTPTATAAATSTPNDDATLHDASLPAT